MDARGYVRRMPDELPEVVLTTTVSVDGRITLGRDQLLLDPKVGARWEAITVPGAFENRHTEIAAQVILEGSGSFVPPDAVAPQWPEPTIGDDRLWEDHLPEAAARWFVVADGRGRVDWVLHRRRRPEVAGARLSQHACRLPAAVARPRRRLLHRRRRARRPQASAGTDPAQPRSHRVIADSGGTLNASLLRAGLVDIVDVVTLPGLVGGAVTPTMMDGPALLADELPLRLHLIDVRVEGDAVRTRYRVRRADGVGGRKHGD